MLNEFVKGIIKLLGKEKRPFVSTLSYLLCGLLGIVSLISIISPFHFSWSLIDGVEWNKPLTNNEMIVSFTFVILIAYLIVYILRKTIVYAFKNVKNSQLRVIYSIAYTIDDIVELIAAIFSLTFMMSVFIQMYKTQTFFQSVRAYFIYAIIGIKCVDFIFNHFRVRNLKVIDNVIKQYPDLD